MVHFVIEIKSLTSGIAEYRSLDSGFRARFLCSFVWLYVLYAVVFSWLWYGKKRPEVLSSYPFKVKVSRKHKIVF